MEFAWEGAVFNVSNYHDAHVTTVANVSSISFFGGTVYRMTITTDVGFTTGNNISRRNYNRSISRRIRILHTGSIRFKQSSVRFIQQRS